MDAAISGELRVEGSGEDVSLTNEDREGVAGGEDFHFGPGEDDARGADKDGFERNGLGSGRERGVKGEDGGVALIAVGVALDDDVEDGEALLGGVADLTGEEDGAGAGAEDWLPGGEGLELFQQAAAVEELEHGGGFAAGHDEAVEVLEAFGVSNQRWDGSGFVKRGGVPFKITLNGEDPNAWGWDLGFQIVHVLSE